MKKSIGFCYILGTIFCLVATNAFTANPEIKSTKAGGYLLYVNEEPFLIKGVGYNPTPIGKSYDYDLFSDPNKPWLTDGKLMKEAGINCVRIYSPGKDLEKVKEFIRDMYEKYGIYTLMSDWLGLWDYPRANYSDQAFKDETKERILKVVEALKDEEGLLLWILGNENNYTFSGKIGFWTCEEIEKLENPRQKQIRKAEIYYTFINDLTKEIKKIDPVHPITLGNGEDNFLTVASSICKDIDALSIIIYRGKKFGNLFGNIRNSFDKPILLSEFGCDSYDAHKGLEDQDIQSEFILSQWEDLYSNTAFSGKEEGNSLGGVIFEWSDEWWKYNESYGANWPIHNEEADWSHGAYFYDIRAKDNLNMNEEWFGLVGLSEEIDDNGLNKRLPKKSYYALAGYLTSLEFNSLK
ncbi:MAG: hypothetical protein HQ570_00520 [Candidatus Omnitrophica bacterium]|nr:hypothetical protein [Candidatus Omnitrophota bacterium]